MIPKISYKQKNYIGGVMIDNLKTIHQRDKSDALGIASKQVAQFLHNFNFKWKPPKIIYEIIVAGMGGSGLAAKAYSEINDLGVPFSVHQNYNLPGRVDENTLLICSSYSGNTEETVGILQQVLDSDYSGQLPMIVVVTSGGKLLELAKSNDLPYILLPTGFQPRFTFGYQFRALVEIMACTPLIDGELVLLEASLNGLNKEIENWLPEISSKNNLAKQIALDVIGKSPVIYAGSLFSVAYKWKISFNENAKNIAWCNQLPEFNHNEFMGWSSHPVEKPYAPIFLKSSLDHPQVTKRFGVSAKLLSGKMPAPIEVDMKGETLLRQAIWAIILGDFVSIYTALLNNVDPTPVVLIEKLKTQLK